METSTLKPKFKIPKPQSLGSLSVDDANIFRETDKSYQINKALIEECIGGILVFTDQPQLVYASESAHRVLSQLQQDSTAKSLIPNEIWHICRSLIQSRHLFPDQNWLIEFDIFTSAMTTLHICARWLNVDVVSHPCLLLTIEDRQQAIINLVLEEADRYGLTPREKNVWLLHHNNYTYKQIAAELGITPNTVKKHMRSIYAKKKAQQEPDA
jgi:RNA polymerase sigma factor (sigma-70 family)